MKGALVMVSALCFLSVYVNLGDAISCLNCLALIGANQDCEVNPSAVSSVPCLFTFPACSTTVTVDLILTRECSLGTTCSVLNATGGLLTCSVCDTDNCNNAVP